MPSIKQNHVPVPITDETDLTEKHSLPVEDLTKFLQDMPKEKLLHYLETEIERKIDMREE